MWKSFFLLGSVLRFLDEIFDFDAKRSNGRFAINPRVYTLCSYYEILLYVIYPARLRRNKWYFESDISVNLIRIQFCSRDVPQDFPTFRWLCSWQSHTDGHFIEIWKKLLFSPKMMHIRNRRRLRSRLSNRDYTCDNTIQYTFVWNPLIENVDIKLRPDQWP